MKKQSQIFFAFALIFVLTVLPILTQEAKAQWVDPPAAAQSTVVPWDYVPDNGGVVHPYGWFFRPSLLIFLSFFSVFFGFGKGNSSQLALKRSFIKSLSSKS